MQCFNSSTFSQNVIATCQLPSNKNRIGPWLNSGDGLNYVMVSLCGDEGYSEVFRLGHHKKSGLVAATISSERPPFSQSRDLFLLVRVESKEEGNLLQ